MSVSRELLTYLKVLWRYKWMILACATLSAIFAFGLSLKLTPRYEATATVRVASAPGGTDDYIYLISLSRLSNTYVEIATSDTSLEQVADELGIQELPDVEIETMPDTELIMIKGINADPMLACDIANTLASIMVDQSMQLYGGDAPTMRQILEDQLQQAKIELDTAVIAYDTTIRNSQSFSTPQADSTPIPDAYLETLSRLVDLRHQIYNELLVDYEKARINEQFHANAITIVEQAHLPEKPTTPNLPINEALGLAAGLAMGVVLAFILEGLDDSIQCFEDVQELTTIPILCKVPVLTRTLKPYRNLNLSRAEFQSLSPILDRFYAHIRSLDTPREFASYIITSPESGSGKTTCASNYALSLALKGEKTVLIDMEGHCPSRHSYLGLPNSKGLSNYLHGESQWDEILQETAYPNLWVITAGSIPNLQNELVIPEVIGDIFNRLKFQCKHVFLDVPDLQSIAEPSVLFSHTDAIILVVARYKTQKQQLRDALQQLSDYKMCMLGILFNKAETAPRYDYYTHRNALRRSQPAE